MSIVTTKGGDAVSMTSLELVDFINAHRKQQASEAQLPFPCDEFAELQHDDLMKKVPRVLKKDAGKFSDIYLDSMNRRQKCYRFPKRESCLMAMSYSYELQAAVFDHMSELEGILASRAAFNIPQDLPNALRLAADLAEEKAVLVLENQQQASKIESLESLFMAGETPTQFCKRLNGVNCSQVNSSLLALGWIYNAADDQASRPRYRVASRVRDRYLTERPRKISAEGTDPFIKYDLTLLIAGARRLHELYVARKLAMKTKWNGEFTLAKFNSEMPL